MEIVRDGLNGPMEEFRKVASAWFMGAGASPLRMAFFNAALNIGGGAAAAPAAAGPGARASYPSVF